MKRLFLSAIMAMLSMAPPLAAAAEAEVAAVLSVMGYGHTVTVLVNGADTGITGGKSQSMRLFSKGHPWSAKATPDMRARNFVLVPGPNILTIEFTRDPKSSDRLTIELEAEGYPAPLFKLSNQEKASGRHVVKVQIEPKAPQGFKPLVISDSK